MPMRGGLRLGQIRGIAIYADWSLLIIFVLITTMLAGGLFPAWHPQWSAAESWLTALGAALLFFASVLAHELSHALVGRARGIEVRRITLFVFGGMAELEREPHEWRAELSMAIVGPVTSLALGIAFLLLAGVTAGPATIDPEDPLAALTRLGVLPTLLFWLGQVNIILALFNLVPAFPLDGGRVLRAILWGVTGNLRRATRWASLAGQAFAWLLIAAGLAMILGAQVPIFGAGLLGGVWIAFIGWFLNNAALASYRTLLVREALQDLPVSSLMQTDYAVVSPDMPVAAFVDEHLMRRAQRAFPVVENGELMGIVGLQDVRGVERRMWDSTRVRAIMTPRAELKTADTHDDALEALGALGHRGVNQVPVLDRQGRLQGLLRREDLLKWLSLYGEGVAGARAPGPAV